MGPSHRLVYKDKRWEPLRRATFRRDNHTCQICGKLVRHEVDRNHPHKGICDHIVPLSKDLGLAFEIDNLQTLHKACHDRHKQGQDKGKRMQRDDGW